MKIKVNYHMTSLDKALWTVRKKFGDEEFEPKAERVWVRGLKDPSREFYLSDDWMDCKAQTGLTEAEYQARHHIAWSA